MLVLTFALVVLASEAAPTPDPAPAASAGATAPVAAADDDSRVICVNEKQMGSHFKKKTCLTKAQWKKRRDRDKGDAERALTPETSDLRPQ